MTQDNRFLNFEQVLKLSHVHLQSTEIIKQFPEIWKSAIQHEQKDEKQEETKNVILVSFRHEWRHYRWADSPSCVSHVYGFSFKFAYLLFQVLVFN